MDRQALGTVSSNALNIKVNSHSKDNILSKNTVTTGTTTNIDDTSKSKKSTTKASICKTNPKCMSLVSKPTTKASNSTKHNIQKLKLKLQIAYYKVKTDQTKTSINEILKKDETCSLPTFKPNVTRLTSTPKAKSHVSLLAASTPISSSIQKQKSSKKVSFDKNKTNQPILKPSSSALSRISDYPNETNKFSLSFPAPKQSKQQQKLQQNQRSFKIEDLVNNNSNNDLNNSFRTPIKRRNDENGDLILSSPTKKLYSSTPGSYGAAKSLLQLSLISSN